VATQGRPLSPDFQRAIVLAKDYFDRTKGDLREQEGSSAERTAHALGVGFATVKRVMADSKRSPAGLIQEESIRRGRPPRVLSDSLQTIDIIRNNDIMGGIQHYQNQGLLRRSDTDALLSRSQIELSGAACLHQFRSRRV